MSIEMFKELTNEQLKQECKDQGITKIEAKNPAKPNKAEYLAAIEKHLNYGADDVAEVPSEVTVVDTDPESTRKPQSAAQLARLEMFRKDRVIIHDVQENQSKDKDELLLVSWGNRLLGGNTDFVALNGQPQYIRRGAINNLLEATTVLHRPNPSGNGVSTEVVKRFIVSEVTGLSLEELETLASQQKMRNSKHA